MEVNAYFTLQAVNQDACVTIDFTKYTYVMNLRQAYGEQDILHAEPETAFTQDGHSVHHHMTLVKIPPERPLVYCDIFCQGLCTDKNILINSFPDASATNNWTVFNKKFSSAETTKNPAFDKICTISNHRVFIDSQFPVGHPMDPFEKSKIERQLGARLRYRSSDVDYMEKPYPDQGDASLCGPAVFFYILLKDRPDIYTEYIKNLWNDGVSYLGKFKIEPSKAVCHPINYTEKSGKTRISAIDWISMASLRDEDNIYLDYGSPDYQFSGLTMPSGIVKWMKALNSDVIYNKMTLFSWARRNVLELSCLVGPGCHVVVLINHGLLLGGSSGIPTHWVVWESNVIVVSTQKPIDENTSDEELVDIKIFSWGDVGMASQYGFGSGLTLKKLCSYIYGGVVFNKIP